MIISREDRTDLKMTKDKSPILSETPDKCSKGEQPERLSMINLSNSINPLGLVTKSNLHQTATEAQNEELAQTRRKLNIVRCQWQELYDKAPFGCLYLNSDGLIDRCNRSGASLFNLPLVKVLKTDFRRYIAPNYLDAYNRAIQQLTATQVNQRLEVMFNTTASDLWIQVDIALSQAESERDIQWRLILWDISEKKQLEQLVEKQAVELQQLSEQLQEEIHQRKQEQEKLQGKTQALKFSSTRLQEANAALDVLLDKREHERHIIEQRVVCNINELVRPHLLKLAAGKLNHRQQALIEAVSKGLDDIISPLSRRFILDSSRLSPMEIKVAGLIRQGQATKEIAGLLGVAVSTIDFHRLNIRRKLNLKNRHVNLQAYLQSLA